MSSHSVYMDGPRHLAVFSGAKPNSVLVSNEMSVISASCSTRKQTKANFNYRSATGFCFLWLKLAFKITATCWARRRFHTVGVTFTAWRTTARTPVTHCHSSIKKTSHTHNKKQTNKPLRAFKQIDGPQTNTTLTRLTNHHLP